MTLKSLAFGVAFAIAGAGGPAFATANLVQNGSFEFDASGNPTVVGQINVFTTLQDWTVTQQSDFNQPHAFAFIVDKNADSVGFPSENSPPNIHIWGPGTGVNNGFTDSPDGGSFLGVDGAYATASVSQTINGLTVGQQYALGFDWAASQFTDRTGATQQFWQVTLGGNTFATPTFNLPSQGFSGWQHFSTTLTATSASEVLSFLAVGAPALPPFVLLDGVSLTSPTTAVPEPGSWAMMLMGFAGLGYAGFRSGRRKAAAIA